MIASKPESGNPNDEDRHKFRPLSVRNPTQQFVPSNVCAEFSLTALVYNLRRALNILGVEAMMAAVRG